MSSLNGGKRYRLLSRKTWQLMSRNWNGVARICLSRIPAASGNRDIVTCASYGYRAEANR